MKKKKIIRAGREIVLLEYIPDLYLISEQANETLSQLRVGMPTWVSEEIYNKMNVSIWVYESDRANAFCYYTEGNNYIALSVGLILDFWNEVNEFVEHEDISLVFNVSKKNKIHIIHALFFYMLNNVIAHEFGHIVHGHLKEASCGNYIDEMFEIGDEGNNNSKNWHTQLKEFDADLVAAALNVSIFLKTWDDNIKVNLANFDIMYLASYLCFRTFAEKTGRNFNDCLEKKLDEFDHPHPGIRMYYTFIGYAYWLGQMCGYTENILSMITSGSHAIIAYEKNVLKKDKIKDCYYVVAFTEKGVQHVMNLNNQWQELIDMYNKYAFIPIQKWGAIDSMPVSVDVDGDFYLK